MKKLLQICLVAIMTLTFSVVAAQGPGKKMVVETSKFSVKVDNPAMEKKILKTFANDKGVLDVMVDAKKDVVTIRYDKAMVNDGKLLKEFEKNHIKAKLIKQAPPKK